jgi:hypothetical protein
MPIASKKPHPQVPSPPAAELARRPASTPATAGRRLWIRGRSDMGLWVAHTAHADGLWALRGFDRARPLRSIWPPASPDCRSPGSATQWARACHAMIREGRVEALDRLRKMALRRGHVFAKRRLPFRAETPPDSVAGKFSSLQPIDKKRNRERIARYRDGRQPWLNPTASAPAEISDSGAGKFSSLQTLEKKQNRQIHT